MTVDTARQSIDAALRNPQLIEAALALSEDRLHDAEPLLRGRLRDVPTDVAAIRMMAELAARIGRLKDSEALLRRALELAPSFGAARANLATILYKQNRFPEALEQLDAVLAEEGDNPAQQNLKAAALGRIGGYAEAIGLYKDLIARFPDHAKLWMSYGHMLKTVGEQDSSIAAYHRALAVEPTLGEVWWSLANLKTVRFSDADLAAMQAALSSDGLSDEDRFHLHFAMGKACEDRAAHEDAFAHYAAGNALRSAELHYDPQTTTAQVDHVIGTMTPEFLGLREGAGNDAADPIFIIGMPRAGSTLIEQILSSHSQIEGTMELPDIPAMAMREARALESDNGKEEGAAWLSAVAEMEPERLAALGAEYVERTRIQRKTAKPFFIDKLPNNWAYLGFIRLILPKAKIIDARRHPLDCCFSNFRQHFAKGQAFSYDLAHMGRYYSDYVRAMAHFDAVLPGYVHRVIHEQLLEDPEGEIRRLLAFLGVPFEEDCLNFHANTRAVRTASSEQVRRPINRDGVDQWKPYEHHLDPLKAALGSTWIRYPAL
ncbi:tetratricopeptide repeat-containing sulfotransferase family protein [Sphingorhabdus contaminans]|uniref:Tetratricopeptide repeat protein n=1 Tax=Sphingorhabdus contaminans TaxID=1343899 RepID=A0A553WKL7_9SPHN|nr:sulfotransferase [Sphingorhabdus contaminans]TSB05206.1 tetratricopeptide repeat protein [Sphingorhabdus contaminans]